MACERAGCRACRSTGSTRQRTQARCCAGLWLLAPSPSTIARQHPRHATKRAGRRRSRAAKRQSRAAKRQFVSGNPRHNHSTQRRPQPTPNPARTGPSRMEPNAKVAASRCRQLSAPSIFWMWAVTNGMTSGTMASPASEAHSARHVPAACGPGRARGRSVAKQRPSALRPAGCAARLRGKQCLPHSSSAAAATA